MNNNPNSEVIQSEVVAVIEQVESKLDSIEQAILNAIIYLNEH